MNVFKSRVYLDGSSATIGATLVQPDVAIGRFSIGLWQQLRALTVAGVIRRTLFVLVDVVAAARSVPASAQRTATFCKPGIIQMELAVCDRRLKRINTSYKNRDCVKHYIGSVVAYMRTTYHFGLVG